MAPTALIIGAGIGGLAAGIALQRAGWQIEVYEAAAEPSEVGAGLTLWANAMHALRALGLHEQVAASGIIDQQGGTVADWHGNTLSDLATAALLDQYQAPIVVVQRVEFQAVLLAALGQSVCYNSRLRGYIEQGDQITALFADGREATGDILIGADGLRSATRQQLFGGRGPAPRYAGYVSWRAVAHIPHDQINAWGERWGCGQRFGIVPLNQERVYYFATRNAPPGTARGSTPASRLAALQAYFGDWAAPVPALLTATAPEAILLHDTEELPPLPRWGAGRVTLLGDAAHAMTPNLGQGACQALEDAVTLAHALRTTTDPALALRQYEALRRPRVTAIQHQARLLGEIGQIEQPLLCAIRNRVLRLVPGRLQLRAFATMLDWMPPTS